MNSLRLKNRMIFVPQVNKIKVSDEPISGVRRGKNYIQEEDLAISENFSDVFNMDDEYSNISKSNDLFKAIDEKNDDNKNG